MPFWNSKPNIEKLKAKRDIAGLIEALEYKKDINIPITAIQALAEVGDETTSKLLFDLYQKVSTSPRLKETILDALGQLGDPNATSLLRSRLEFMIKKNAGSYIIYPGSYDEATKIVSALGQMGDPHVAELIIRIERAGTKSSHLTAACQTALQALQSKFSVEEQAELAINQGEWDKVASFGKAAIAPLVDCVIKQDHTSSKAHELLRIFDYADIAEIVLPIVQVGKRGVDRAVLVLTNMDRTKTAAQMLIIMNNTENTSLARDTAIGVLGGMMETTAIEPLITLLNDTDEKIRTASIKALGSIRDTLATQPLIEMLTKEPANRNHVIEALEKIGDARALNPLITVLNDADSNLTSHILRFIEEFTKPNNRLSSEDVDELSIRPLLDRLQDDNPEVRDRTARLLQGLLEIFLSVIISEDLQIIADVANTTTTRTTYSEVGCFTDTRTTTVEIDLAHLHQLARQELIRRGEKA